MSIKIPATKIEAAYNIRKRIESIKKKKMASDSVVSLVDFRELKNSISSRSILVVDDDEIMRAALKRILEAQGYRVMMAEDGLELSRVLENNRLDMILLDVNLPWVDGYELCRILKEHHSLRKVPVLMVSARNGKEDIEKGISSGATDYVTKPFDIDSMIKSIENAFMKAVS